MSLTSETKNFTEDDLRKLRNEVEADLQARKGKWWTRKVVYFTGMRALIPLLEAPQKDSFIRMLSVDMIKNLEDEYSDVKDQDALGKEFRDDCTALENRIVDIAVERGYLPAE